MNELTIETVDWEYKEGSLPEQCYEIPDLEEAVLSCLLQKDELMNHLIVSEKDFHQYPKVFKYMKQFYENFQCLDLILMTSRIDYKEKKQFEDTFIKLKYLEPAISNFELYQKALLAYNKKYTLEVKKDQLQKKMAEKLVLLQNKHISLEEYFDEIEKIKESWINENE